MTSLTTMKITPATRDELKALAERDGITIDAALQKLLRSERQRQMGRDLAARLTTDQPRSDEDQAWVAASNAAVARAIG